MQQFGSVSSLYDQDTAVYTVGRSSTEALIGMDQETGSLMMGWDDDDDNDDDNDLACLGRQPKLPADVITTELHHNNNHNHNHHHHNHNNHQHSHGLHDLELEDNTQLLQDMLQQDQTTCNNIINLPVSTTVSHHAAVGGESEQQQQYCSSTAAAWEESIHVLQEMLLLQQHQQSIPPSQEHLIFSTGFNNMGYPMGNNNNTINSALSQIPFNPDSSNTAKFPGESELLSLLQLPRCASSSLPPGSSIQSSVSSKKVLGGIIPPNYSNNPIDLGDNSNNNPSSLYMDSHLMQPAAAGYSLSFRNLVHNLPLTNAANYKLGTGHNDQIEKDHAAVFSGSILGEGGHVSAPIFDFKHDGGLQQQQKVGEPRVINHFATERQRREYLNEKYQTLRSLVPNPTKSDRASIVQDAIEYVKELKRTVQELQLLVQEKRRGKYGKISNNGGGNGHLLMRKRKLEGGGTGNSNGDQAVQESGGSSSQCRGGEGGDYIMLISDDILANDTTGLGCQLRSSWLQRSSQNGTQVDVRIVDDEVNIKLSLKKQHHHHHHHLLHHHPPPPQQQQQQQQQQQANTRRISSLLNVVVMLQELHLDILHANGASIGEHHIFMFNTKIMEGSSTYAGQIAAKLIEAVDRNISSQLILC